MRCEANKYRHWVFILICAIYLALAFAYAILVPPWEAPDEPAHYLYAQQLAERGRPPLQPAVRQRDSFCRDYPYISSNYQWYQPALGYLPAALVYQALDIFAPNSLPRQIPALNPQFCDNPYTHPNLFLHTNPKILEIWKENWGLLIMRICSALLGLAVIFAAYRTGCLLEQNNGWLGIIAAGWLAFLPQFIFTNAYVQSDMVANMIAAFVFLLASLMQPSTLYKNKLALGIGLLLGLGVLSKHTFVYIVPIGVLTVILTNPRSPRAWLKPLALLLLPAVILFAAYHLAFDEARAALTHTILTPRFKMRIDLLTIEYLKDNLPLVLIDSFFARFGWMNVMVPTSWSRLGFGLWCVGAAMTFAQVLRQRNIQQMITLLKVIIVLGVAVILTESNLLLSVFRPTGRHLFTILVPWSLWAFWGFWQIFSMRGRAVLTFAALGFMLAFNLYALFFCLIPAYYK